MPSPLVNPPTQTRSRETLERILAVTEELLEEQSFGDISVQEIVSGANTSVGAFYTRFRDKQALLPLLYKRYDAALAKRVLVLERRRAWKGRSLPEVVEWAVKEIVRLFSLRKNLMRALALYARESPLAIEPGTVARRRDQRQFLRDALLSRRAEIRHPDPERAAEMALFFIASVVRERILFADATHSASVGTTIAELKREVTRMALGYLGYADRSARPRPRKGPRRNQK